MKYLVNLQGKEWTVEVNPDGARIDGEEVRLEAGLLPGEQVVVHRERRLRFLPLPVGREGRVVLLVDGRLLEARVESERERLRSLSRPAASGQRSVKLSSAIPGVIRQLLRRVGERVEGGEALMTLEAMKMENEIRSDVAGRIATIHVREGQVVNAGETLAVIEPD